MVKRREVRIAAGNHRKVYVPSGSVIPRAEDSNVVWRFHRVDRDGDFAFELSKLDHKLILEKLLEYSTPKRIYLKKHGNV